MALRTLLASAVFALCSFTTAAQEPIRVGAFLSVTGPAAFLGDPEQRTLELYVEKLNSAGGLLGRKLQLIAYDSAGDAEKARGYVKRLIEQDKVDLLSAARPPAKPWPPCRSRKPRASRSSRSPAQW